MSLPLVKLLSLAVKTASKPLANRIKARLKESPVWQGRALTFMQWYHRTSIQTQRTLAGYPADAEVKPMNDNRAVSEFADMVGEAFLFGVGLGLLVYENSRKGASDAKSKAQSIDTDEAHAERLRRLEASAGATLLRLQALEEALLEEREAREAERQAAEAVRPRRGSGWLGFAARGA
uniref:OPA3-like protein n=1 Tax=Prasinoderma singulare TaxID=676789 RepID=A0A7S3C168_9VIRI|mmetsp:Transcript_7082/g.21382  ORF Transcript_7082/g.21382 Transcript_7082/m.21382 type:complete len:178 (+) Transcript_7082:254-787(+)